VIYNTLIVQSEPIEVVAVLTHELGHWTNWDTIRQLLIVEVYLFTFFLTFSTFIENGSLYRSFGFLSDKPILIGLLLFNDVWQSVDHVIKWAMQIISRRNEYSVGTRLEYVPNLDQFALNLGYKDELARALIRLEMKNLSAMDADWLFSAYNHSHPILMEQLRALGYKGGENIFKDEKASENSKIE
jgi:STE24 endopeptidase